MDFTLDVFKDRLEKYFEKNKSFAKYVDYKTLEKDQKFLNYGERQAEFAMLFDGKLISKYEYEFDNKYDSEEFVSKIFYANVAQEKNIPFVINHESYFFNRASTEVIEAIERSTIVVVQKSILDKVIESDSDLKEIFSEFEERSFMELTNRLRDLQSLSTKHKIEKFQRENPELLSIKIDHIIKYLGIRSKDTYYRILRKLRE
ncbi:hypothetical protein [Lutibacter sp.]|uniref:hypothetical protein n=1 Tax=Lutibacter sp. TaxID=1925666 RepID=UPI001A2CB455|nr:hypothetical protein [Lutibacter sp.]MBI9041957.1 Crp/Fnr family transcriptional regulator [Lutibacter sp.]